MFAFEDILFGCLSTVTKGPPPNPAAQVVLPCPGKVFKHRGDFSTVLSQD